MDEQQIISDIVDELYGYDYFLQEGKADTIKAKKEERKEKSDEIMRQINNICEKLEKELESVFGNDVKGMRKKIKLQVLTTIKSKIKKNKKLLKLLNKWDWIFLKMNKMNYLKPKEK